MNQNAPHTKYDPQILGMLSGMNASADMAVVQRTRRAVMQAAAELREQRRRNRRNAAIAGLTIAVLVMVLTPAIWSTLDDVLNGGDFFEVHSMMMVLTAILFSTILGALLIGSRSHRQVPHERR